MVKGKLFLVLIALAFTPHQAKAQNILTLDQTYQNVLDQNPQIQSHRAQIMAAEGARMQAGTMPNPEAVFEVEDFGGDSPRNGFSGAEYTLGLEQQVEIAGKRSKRERVASIEKEAAEQQALAGIQSILAQSKAAYMNVAIAQKRLELANDRAFRADKTHSTVKRRISAAKAAEIQHTKADLEVSSAEVAQRAAEKDLSLARMRLANLMGLPALSADVNADLSALPDAPEQAAVMEALDQTPMSVLSELAIARENSALELARANGVPDPTFGLGVRRYNEDDGTAFMASISIPLTIFDRNKGNIAQAKANLLSAEADQKAMRLAVESQAMELWQVLKNAEEEVRSYQSGLLPSAQKSYKQSEDGFDRGAFTYLDLLDAQRTLFDVQENYLQALEAYHEADAQLDLFTGAYAGITAKAIETQ